jgi:hypothetical protein
MSLVTIARFTDPPSAHVARALLEAHGIDAYLGNEHYVGMDWLHSQAVGGVELKVVSEQATRAQEILDSPEPPPAFTSRYSLDDSQPSAFEVCPACSAQDVESDRLDHRIRAASLGFGIPVSIGAYRFRCRACGHRFRARPPHRGLFVRVTDAASFILGTFLVIVFSPVWMVASLLGSRAGGSLECWSCGTPFSRGAITCESCGIAHPPEIAFERVIEVGRDYDATCDACHTPYVRADYQGIPDDWRCSICGDAIGSR